MNITEEQRKEIMAVLDAAQRELRELYKDFYNTENIVENIKLLQRIDAIHDLLIEK